MKPKALKHRLEKLEKQVKQLEARTLLIETLVNQGQKIKELKKRLGNSKWN